MICAIYGLDLLNVLGMLCCMKSGSPPELLSVKKFLWMSNIGHHHEGKTMPHETVVCICAG